ncbi:hypothetical protein CCO03_17785 [Comamonas serinivorans]|uniref:Uncharacterized protein n=1 Tax=Comamonas serinivorans TaxID=1082851 RepID=A0A1Y0ES94_9BURK|nr:hypothetical protein CCO03_17785 [Comamonas serinivorans]
MLADDERLIRNLMRMFSHDPTFRWQYSEGSEFDVLVIDAKKIEDTRIKRTARTVLRLSDVAVPNDDHVLTRPLQASAFRNWLLDAESALTHFSRPASTLAPREPSRRKASSSEPKALRFKLRSWPPAIMMHNDAHRQQMAQLLSVDAFEVTELAQITGAPLAECQAFVRKLQLVGLLDLVSVDRESGPATLPMDEEDFGAETAIADEPVGKSGFSATIGRLRERLRL